MDLTGSASCELIKQAQYPIQGFQSALEKHQFPHAKRQQNSKVIEKGSMLLRTVLTELPIRNKKYSSKGLYYEKNLNMQLERFNSMQVFPILFCVIQRTTSIHLLFKQQDPQEFQTQGVCMVTGNYYYSNPPEIFQQKAGEHIIVS